jgi:hypothetical protein
VAFSHASFRDGFQAGGGWKPPHEAGDNLGLPFKRSDARTSFNLRQGHLNWRRSMSNHWMGRCLCGAVQYEARGASLAQLICHCRDCQRASGSAGLPVVVVSATEFSFEGEIRSYTKIGGSGMPTTRNFCTHCGSLLFGTPQHAPEIVSIYAGTLDDPSRFKAEFVQFASERYQLDVHQPDAPQHLRRAP